MNTQDCTTSIRYTTSMDGTTVWMRQHDSIQQFTLDEVEQMIKMFDELSDFEPHSIGEHTIKQTPYMFWIHDRDGGNTICFSPVSYHVTLGLLRVAVSECLKARLGDQ